MSKDLNEFHNLVSQLKGLMETEDSQDNTIISSSMKMSNFEDHPISQLSSYHVLIPKNYSLECSKAPKRNRNLGNKSDNISHIPAPFQENNRVNLQTKISRPSKGYLQNKINSKQIPDY